MIRQIPKCPMCKSQKNIITESAWTKTKTRIIVSYCKKCLCVASAEVSAVLKKESLK